MSTDRPQGAPPRGGLVALVVLPAILLAAIVWAYWPILQNGFVWDDGGNLLTARAFWDRGLGGIAWAFREPFGGHYQPLTWMSYQLDAAISGATPRGVHATQLALHLLVTLLVAALAHTLAQTVARTSTRRPNGGQGGNDARWTYGFPLLAAALFGLAPIRVESVAWATERRDLLGALFAIAAVLVYLRAAASDAPERRALGDSSARSRWAVAALLALSALSRAQMTLPFVLLLLDVGPLARWTPDGPSRLRAFFGLVREKAVLFAIAAASAAAAIWAQTSAGALTSTAEHGLFARLVQAGYGLGFYAMKALFPHGEPPLLPLYERPVPFPPRGDTEFLMVALMSLGCLVTVALSRRRFPAFATACGTYVLLVLPVLGLAQSGIQLVADRYAYLSTVPLVLAMAGGILHAFGTFPQRAARAAIALGVLSLLASYTVATRRQTFVWRDDETLWRHVLNHSNSILADNNLGQLLVARGESAAALFHLTRSLERGPQYGRPWRSLAQILESPWPASGPSDLTPRWVATTLSHAVKYQAGSALAHFATALAWSQSGDSAQAERELRRALAIDPELDGARLALARIEAQRAPNALPR